MEQIALMVHLTTVFTLVTIVILTDGLGFLWLIGKIQTLPAALIKTLHRLVWTGLIIMIASGATMFLSYQEYLLTVPAFYIKMGFVLTLVINAVAIGKHLHIATERPFALLTKRERIPLLISGIISTAAWIGTISAARMLGL